MGCSGAERGVNALDPGTSRSSGTDDRAVTSHLVSDYFSLTSLIPNAVCALDHVQI